MLAATRIHAEGTVETHRGIHRSVLLEESIGFLRPRPGAVFVDATVGAGGHSEAILEAAGSDGRVYAIDLDPEALAHASHRLARFGDRFVPLAGNHAEIRELLAANGVFAVDGVLADLGVSSLQLDDPARGFSFRVDAPLDMRMDQGTGPTAADLVASLTVGDLRNVLAEFGEERRAATIAREIVQARTRERIATTLQLAELVERVLGPAARRYRIHPATRTFQALRIAVNREIDSIARLIPGAVSLLRRGGRLVVIAFHSLEDRAVKREIRALAHRCICPPGLPVCGCGRENLVRVLTARPVVPAVDEVERNPRSRSARLRAAERL